MMGASNMVGTLAGTHVVTKHGAPFIRKVFIIVLSSTIIKLDYDTLVILHQNGVI